MPMCIHGHPVLGEIGVLMRDVIIFQNPPLLSPYTDQIDTAIV